MAKFLCIRNIYAQDESARRFTKDSQYQAIESDDTSFIIKDELGQLEKFERESSETKEIWIEVEETV